MEYIPVDYPIRTQEEIDELKRQWLRDPVAWDIEDTEGFEAHREELHKFRIEQETKWERQYHETVIAFAKNNLGISLTDGMWPHEQGSIYKLAEYIFRLEGRIKKLESRDD